MEIILKVIDFIQEKNATVFWFAVAVLVTSFGTKKFTLFQIKQAQLEKKCDGICDSHNGIEKKLKLLLDKFNSLIAALAEKKAIHNPDIFSVNSPLNLTDKGESLVEEVGWKLVLDNEEHRQSLFQELDKMKLMIKYDVEKYCIVLLNELNGRTSENPLTPVKKYLYEHADIDEQTVLTACAIYLRNLYLKYHPEIKD